MKDGIDTWDDLVKKYFSYESYEKREWIARFKTDFSFGASGKLVEKQLKAYKKSLEDTK